MEDGDLEDGDELGHGTDLDLADSDGDGRPPHPRRPPPDSM
ncbi:MAG: hypothetical protein ACPGUV_05235 [Polyangiales bacterium]